MDVPYISSMRNGAIRFMHPSSSAAFPEYHYPSYVIRKSQAVSGRPVLSQSMRLTQPSCWLV
jgi:hypothetical protein